MKNTDKVTLTIGQIKKLLKESNEMTLADHIKADLDKKIDEIFYLFQNNLGIKFGDMTPDEMFDLDEKVEDLAKCIFEILKRQKEEM